MATAQRPAPVLALLALAMLALTACGKSYAPVDGYAAGGSVHHGPSPAASGVVRAAQSQVGAPYRWGGKSPSEGFDCSGLAWWAYRVNGLAIPRVSHQQYRTGRAVAASAMLPGDLAFFDTGQPGKALHVGIYSGQGRMIHSPKSGGRVREESLDSSYWRARWIGSRRLAP